MHLQQSTPAIYHVTQMFFFLRPSSQVIEEYFTDVKKKIQCWTLWNFSFKSVVFDFSSLRHLVFLHLQQEPTFSRNTRGGKNAFLFVKQLKTGDNKASKAKQCISTFFLISMFRLLVQEIKVHHHQTIDCIQVQR